ncbi:pyroglutamyl-peptidase I family protein [Geobacillus sp. JS12]|uniref:pyroglutamyl-peptidase I family protein n=1 Tax=Geobacillus sp. JS12 TaxID=1813182 RepID=UPI000AD4662B|nr:hypothetical protein [Geobacillus sp. JS12]
MLLVDFSQSSLCCLEYLEQIQPDVVMSLGLAAERTKITSERVAINCQDGGPDNRGMRVQDELIVEEGLGPISRPCFADPPTCQRLE